MIGESSLAVFLNSIKVGTLEYFEGPESYRFTFDSDYLLDPMRPILGQFFEDRFPRAIPYDSGPPLWFSYLLPPTGAPLRRALARVHGLLEADEFDFYRLLGEDLPGAVRLLPAESSPGRRPQRVPIAFTETFTYLQSALSGMVMKISVNKEGHIVLPVRGSQGDWIAKFEPPEFPALPRIEAATMRWAQLAGILVPDFELNDAPVQGVDLKNFSTQKTYYLVRRFDRVPDAHRVHFEDFAQILDRTDKYQGHYEELAKLIQVLCPGDLRRFVEQLVFCILAGNGDAHLQNWSILYPDGHTPKLSPAYDLVSTILYYSNGRHETLALKLNHSNEFGDINLESFVRMERICGLDSRAMLRWVRECSQRVRDVWSENSGNLGYSPEEVRHLERHLRAITLP